MKDIADLIGRVLIGFIFLYEVLDSVVYFDKTKQTMIEYGLSWKPDILLIGAILLLSIGSFSVLIGYQARIGATLLLIYWLVFTVVVYSFWNDPEDIKQLHAIYFMRNLAICGGLFILIANGAGKYSVNRLIHVMRLPK